MQALYQRILALIAILVVVLGLYSALPAVNPTDLTREQAFSTVIQDVYKDYPTDVEVRVLSESGSDKNWKFKLLITQSPHSACPTLEVRDYELLPLRFRPESLIKDCTANTPITYREEALIHSAQADSFAQGAFGCAFTLKDFDLTKAFEYCPALDKNEFGEFASGLDENSWVIQWTKEGTAKFIALDKNANVLKSKEVGLQE
ncbi:MAG: hypothetical protein V1834_03445 [Candidatus Micrarchaeota archaeon]